MNSGNINLVFCYCRRRTHQERYNHRLAADAVQELAGGRSREAAVGSDAGEDDRHSQENWHLAAGVCTYSRQVQRIAANVWQRCSGGKAWEERPAN